MSETLKGNRKNESGNSTFNQLSFFVDNLIKAGVNTAIPVKVVGVETTGAGVAGYVDVVPLIQSYDGFNNAIDVSTIYKVPYVRIQGGVAALVIDPIVGDIGIAVFAQQDISNLSSEPSKPATFRSFSMADAMYIGGLINQEPSIYMELTQDNICNIIAPSEVNIKTSTCNVECETMTINASSKLMVDTPLTTITGNLITGTSTGSSSSIQMSGQLELTGSMTATQDVIASGISLNSHVHGGVEAGGSDTSVPK